MARWRRAWGGAILAGGLAASGAAPGAPSAGPSVEPSAGPSTQAVIHYNARMALRAGAPDEALRLWLLRNAVAWRTGQVSGADDDLRSVVWAALGARGLCPDGFPLDDDGAGLWPLALHNWLVLDARREPPPPLPNAFLAFSLGRQQRHISLWDVLDLDELRAARFTRTDCWVRWPLSIQFWEWPFAEHTDKQVNGRMMRRLLRWALRTTEGKPVVGRAVIQARLFDLSLALNQIRGRAARRERLEMRAKARQQGMSTREIDAQIAGVTGLDPRSEEGQILMESLGWRAEEWMTLSSARRQFLFEYAASASGDRRPLAPLVLAVIDRLVAARAGAEIESWIAHLPDDPAHRAAVWGGARGRALLGLDKETGFTARAVIALHRAVDALSRGAQEDALRLFALATRWADESSATASVRRLSRRWVSYVAAEYRLTPTLIEALRSTLPRRDFSAVLEDQIWQATLAVDIESFEQAVAQRWQSGALDERVALLRPLARGQVEAFYAGVDEALQASPYRAARFLSALVVRLQRAPAATRRRYVPLLQGLKGALAREISAAEGARRDAKRLTALVDEIRATLEGVTGSRGAAPADVASGLSPDREIFAGAIRVPPADPLPWPFSVAPVDAPRAFEPITLRPEEWRGPDGGLIFGWRVTD